VAFSGLLTQKGRWVTTKVTTASQARIFIAPIGLWITTDAGRIEEVAYNEKTGAVRITLAEADAHTSSAYLRLATTSDHAKYFLTGYETDQHGRYNVPLTAEKQLISASAAL
jgi:hypothetical protein